MDLAYEGGPKVVEELGDDISILSQIASGKHPFSQKLAKANRPMIIVGVSSLAKGSGIHRLARQLEKQFPKLKQDSWNGVNTLHTSASSVGALDLGFSALSPSLSESKFVYLLGVDDEDFLAKIPKDAFVLYQGHHGDAGAQRADLVLPSTAYVEKVGTYVNLEGRPQQTEPAVGPLGKAREDWEIFRALSEVLGVTLPYENFDQVRQRLYDVAPHLEHLDRIETPSLTPPTIEGATDSPSGTIPPLFTNFFATDPISRSSRIMAQCSSKLPKARNSYL
jgi:NADH dehydrogenase (ubiquinone) Fe-S protein 1